VLKLTVLEELLLEELESLLSLDVLKLTVLELLLLESLDVLKLTVELELKELSELESLD
jgi:hypothetical protein